MDPDAEAAFSPELDGFDLVAMAEGHQAADEGSAQAVMTAEPGAPVSVVDAPAVESGVDGSVTFDQLDNRRKSAVGACGAGACGSCVQKCGAYNPNDAGEDFDLVEKATDLAESDATGSDFRSKVQFTGEEARKRMAERKAAKAGEAQPDAADRPTPEQRDQIIEIRRTAADPEMVKQNLVSGHARMAERQIEREARLAELAEQEAARDIPDPIATRPVSTVVEQAEAEIGSRMPAESGAAVQAAATVEAQVSKQKAEETPVTDPIIPGRQTGNATSHSNEIEARQHADSIHAQAASATSSEGSMTQSGKVSSEGTSSDQSDAIDEPVVHEQHRIHSSLMPGREEDVASGMTQTSSKANVTRPGGTRQPATRPDKATFSHSEYFHVYESAHRLGPKPNSARIEGTEAGGDGVPIVRPDADSEADGSMHIGNEFDWEYAESGSEPVFSAADPVHEFRLADTEADTADATYIAPAGRAAPDHGSNMGASRDSDAYTPQHQSDEADEDEHTAAPLKNRKKQKTYKKPPGSTAEIEERRTVAIQSKKDAAIKVSTKSELGEIEEVDESDQTEADGELSAEDFDHTIVYKEGNRRKYSRGSGRREDIWKTNPNNRGKKSVSKTLRKVRSSSPPSHKSKRSRKKFLKLLAALGRFVTYNFSKGQEEVNEGAGA